jgi:hypothetical protein
MIGKCRIVSRRSIRISNPYALLFVHMQAVKPRTVWKKNGLIVDGYCRCRAIIQVLTGYCKGDRERRPEQVFLHATTTAASCLACLSCIDHLQFWPPELGTHWTSESTPLPWIYPALVLHGYPLL